jgi:hypothetical protein
MPKTGGQYDLPDVGPPLLSGGPQVSPGVPMINRAADVLSRYPGHVASNILSLPQRAIENSQYSLDTGTYDPSAPVEAALTAMTGGVAGTGAGGVAVGAGPIRAYHGSPHDFERFDTSKIGTGQGAQSYGHGLYFAEKEEVAKGYRDELAQRIVNGQPVGPAKGHMYEVDINADPAHFLDWDKPLTAQPEAVQKYAEQLKVQPWSATEPLTGREVYEAGKKQWNFGRERAPHEALSEAGVPGIKYLDQGSRGAGEGSYNYAVFNPRIIEIMRKYGIAGAAPLGVGALATREENENANAF